MADRGFLKALYRADIGRNILQIEIVAGVDAESEAAGEACGVAMRAKDAFASGSAERVGIRAGIEFDAIGADFAGAFDLGRVGRDKKATPDAGVTQGREDVAHPMCIAGGEIPAGVGSKDVGRVGHQGGLGRLDAMHQFQKSGAGIALEVELNGEQRGEFKDVTGRDVAGVGTRVDGDAVASGGDAGAGGAEDVRNGATARIPEQSDFIQVDAKPDHFSQVSQPQAAKVASKLAER